LIISIEEDRERKKAVRDFLFQRYGDLCRLSKFKYHTRPANSLHHRLSQTEINKRKFPVFIHSIYNMIPLNIDSHEMWPVPRFTEQKAIYFERILRKRPMWAIWANDPRLPHPFRLSQHTSYRNLFDFGYNLVQNYFDKRVVCDFGRCAGTLYSEILRGRFD